MEDRTREENQEAILSEDGMEESAVKLAENMEPEAETSFAEYTDPDEDEKVEETLEHRLDRAGETPLYFEDKRRILLEICQELEKLHLENRAYGTVCAENVILTYPARTVTLREETDPEEDVNDGDAETDILKGKRAEQKSVAQDIFDLGKLIYRVLPESDRALEIAEKATSQDKTLRFGSVKEVREQLLTLWDPSLGILSRSREQVKLAAKSRKLWIGIGIAAAALILIAVGAYFFGKNVYPDMFVKRPAYNDGVEAMESENYEEAIRYFRDCGEDYKDAGTRIRACELELYRRGIEDNAKEKTKAWQKSGNKADLENAVKACYSVYEEGLDDGGTLQELGLLVLENVVTKLDRKEYEEAESTVKIFTGALPEKKNDMTRTLWADFYKTLAMGLENAGKYLDASGYYRELKEAGYKDYEERLQACKMAYAEEFLKQGRTKDALGVFQELAKAKVEGAEEKVKEASYIYGKELLQKEDYGNALNLLTAAGNYQDAEELAKKAGDQIKKAREKELEEKRRREEARNQGQSGSGSGSGSGSSTGGAWSLGFKVLNKSGDTVRLSISFRGGPADGTPGFICVAKMKDGTEYTGEYSIRIKGGSSQTITMQDEESEDLYSDISWVKVFDSEGRLMGTWTP